MQVTEDQLATYIIMAANFLNIFINLQGRQCVSPAVCTKDHFYFGGGGFLYGLRQYVNPMVDVNHY